MNTKEFQFLSNISELTTKEIDISELCSELKKIFSEYISFQNLSLYIFDDVTNTLRNCADNWCVIDDKDDAYEAFENLKEHDFVINKKAYKLPPQLGDIKIKITSFAIPLVKGEKVFGLIKIDFNNEEALSIFALQVMKIFAAEISLKIQNIVLNEQSKINVDFHDSMKNIAKIIETQYELNYIVPLIGEMLDRFISDHLIYIFLRSDDEFKLVWPKACNDERIYEAINQLTIDTEYILTNNDKIGAFPLISDNEITGCIAARSTLDKLSKRDISYLEQLIILITLLN